jgi:hypothetical protein
VCSATTVVTGQSTVFAGGKLVSVVGDPDSHGAGEFIDNGRRVLISGKRVIAIGDSASADNLCIPIGPPHCAPDASSGISTVVIG